MITLKDFMETVDYRITEGSDYCWQCYGTNAYRLDSWNQDQEGHSISIVFDTRTQVVYEASAYDYSRNRAYRIINPDFKFAHDDEASGRDVDINQAWDDVNYIDLETDEDFLAKARAIVADEDYDTRVSVPITLPDDVLFEMMKRAHEQDITFNELVEDVLWTAIRAEEARQLDEIADEHEDLWEDEMGSDLHEMRDEYDFSDGVRGAPAKMKAKKKKKDKK